MLPVLWSLLSVVYLLVCAGLAACGLLGSLCRPLARTGSFVACRNLFGFVLVALATLFGLTVIWVSASSCLAWGWQKTLSSIGSADTFWLGVSAVLPWCLCWPPMRRHPTVVLAVAVAAFYAYGSAFLLVAAGA